MDFALNVPLNNVSFGQLSTAIAKELFSRGLEPAFFPLGKVDLSAQKEDAEFTGWLNKCGVKGAEGHSRKNPAIKLWHLNNDSLFSVSELQNLITFYELDAPTKHELNVIRNNNKVYVTSEYTKSIFNSHNADNVEYLPLFFDANNFKRKEEAYYSDNRITFNLCGKFEKRKHHAKILNAWAKKFGNDKKYYLNCAVFNTFIKPEDNDALIRNSLEGQSYFNINFLGFMGHNEVYNDYLNSGDIVIGMSGGEGWGLPEFQSVALGKHAVILNASGYKSWADKDNVVLVEPKEKKIPVYDGMFFQEGAPVNQGNIFDWDADDFISACEEAIKKLKDDKVNHKGLELQSQFPIAKTVDTLLKGLE